MLESVVFNMDLKKIQELNSVSEIFDFIITNSCSVSNTNKNLEIKDWTNFDYDCYLINNVVNKKLAESSLDYLMASNTRNFRNIHATDLDLENTISQSRFVIYVLLCQYLEGLYDKELLREFNFQIEGDINQFKRLFEEQNIDTFVSHLLIKSQQSERKGLSNRIQKSVKDEEGKWRSVSEYVIINEISFEKTLEEEKKKNDIESYLYKTNQLNNDLDTTIVDFKADNIFAYINNHKESILTEKQLAFVNHYLSSDETTSFEELFRCDDDYMSKQLKCSYRKNIVSRVERELLIKDDTHIKKGEKYYTLIKTDSRKFIDELLSQKNNKSKFEVIAKEIKKNTQTSKYIIDLAIEENVLNYFNAYLKGIESIDLYRFLTNNNRFNNFINKLTNKLGDCNERN